MDMTVLLQVEGGSTTPFRNDLKAALPTAGRYQKCLIRQGLRECGKQDLNLHEVLTSLGPQPSASANSAIPANWASICGFAALRLPTLKGCVVSVKR